MKRQFIKTSVPTSKYQEVKKVGENYVCRFEPEEDQETGVIVCYECVTTGEPDMENLRAELAEYKVLLQAKELSLTKENKKKQLSEYDSSDAVNSFAIFNKGTKMIDYWISRDLRTSLEGDVLAAQSIGDSYKFDIRELGISLLLDCNKFLTALAVLRQYAYTCYNVTSEHLANIDKLESVADVEAYDFTAGYPEKLAFDISELA